MAPQVNGFSLPLVCSLRNVDVKWTKHNSALDSPQTLTLVSSFEGVSNLVAVQETGW